MNAAKLLSHFDRISDTPEAIPRLRQFILDLAVRGKLVQQDRNEESASELLKRIQAERARLIKLGEIKKVELPSLREDERPFTIPTNWSWTRLGEIADWGSGSTPPKGSHDYYGGAISWFKSGELNDDPQLRESEETVTEFALEKCSFRRNQPGDVLIAMYGATIGKVAILAGPAVTNQAVCGCTPFQGVLNLYLFKFLMSQRVQFHSASEGGAQPNISKVKIVRFPFPLPPLAEQHRIVAKVDELMALCDRLEASQAEREHRRDLMTAASLNRLSHLAGTDATTFQESARFLLSHVPQVTSRPDQIQQLRQTILNVAIRGNLGPQDPKDEPASELVKRIRLERARLVEEGEAKDQKRQSANEVAAEPFGIPQNWQWVLLGDLAFGFRYGTSVKCSYEQNGEPVLRIPNVARGIIDVADLKYGQLSAREAEDLRLQLGDILIVRSNGSLNLVGRPALVEAHAVGFCYAGYLVRVRTSLDYLNTRYLLLALNTDHVRSQIEIPIRTTVGLKNVNATELSNLRIPLPPLSEQHRIVATVNKLMNVCEQLEVQLTTARTENSRLLEAVLHQALSISA
jgi:type I restriction enzyme, S subunit